MPPNTLWAAAFSLFLRHSETGCPKSARQAADLLDRLSDDPELDRETRTLCARASDRLGHDHYAAAQNRDLPRRLLQQTPFRANYGDKNNSHIQCELFSLS